MYRFAEEVSLVGWMWRLGTVHGQCIRQGQGPTKPAAVTVTTVAGHVRTVVVVLAPLASARSVESLAPLAAKPPSSSDPTRRPIDEGALFWMGFLSSSSISAAGTSQARIGLGRRLLRRHLGRRTYPSFLLSTAARDPDTAALPTIDPPLGVASGR
jgi:hypothetical protein